MDALRRKKFSLTAYGVSWIIYEWNMYSSFLHLIWVHYQIFEAFSSVQYFHPVQVRNGIFGWVSFKKKVWKNRVREKHQISMNKKNLMSMQIASFIIWISHFRAISFYFSTNFCAFWKCLYYIIQLHLT